MKNITVIGSGTMGNGIAHCFAQNGFEVNLVDLNQEALLAATNRIEKNMQRQVDKGVLELPEKQAALARITTTTQLQVAAQTSDLIIEAATENLEVKKSLFEQIDQWAPADCILASNTSSLSITALASFTRRPEKVVGMHFMNPVPIMKLIEIIQGQQTAQATLEAITSLSEQLDKVPLMAKDYPGFIANRILLPMINEAIETLFQGVGGVYEIDEMMKLGMGHPMGPLRLADFIGLDVCLAVLEVLHQGFGQPKYAPCPLLVNLVKAGQLGVKTKNGFYNYAQDIKNPSPNHF